MLEEPRPRLRGKVARVVSARELVINKGSLDGVQRGMVFAVLDPKGADILDPDTKESLGSLRRPKVLVRVSHVEERLAVAGTFETETVNLGGSSGSLAGIAALFQPPRYVQRYKTFRNPDAPWEDIDEEDSYVKTGDPVEEVLAVDAQASVEGTAGS